MSTLESWMFFFALAQEGVHHLGAFLLGLFLQR